MTPKPDPRPRHPGQDDRWTTRRTQRKTNPDRRQPVARRE